MLEAVHPGGSRFDPPGRRGLGWLAAEVRWRGGTATWSTERHRWAPYVEDVSVDVVVGAETVVATWRCPTRRAETCVDGFLEALEAPSWSEEGLAVARERRRRRLERSPTERAVDLARRAAHGPHPYGQPAIGWSEEVVGGERAAVRLHGERTLVRSALQIRTAGLTEELRARIGARITGLPARPPLDAPLPPPQPTTTRVFVASGPSTSVAWVAVGPGPGPRWSPPPGCARSGELPARSGLVGAWGEDCEPSDVGAWVGTLDASAEAAGLRDRRVGVVTDAVGTVQESLGVEERASGDVEAPSAANRSSPWRIGPADVRVLEEKVDGSRMDAGRDGGNARGL